MEKLKKINSERENLIKALQLYQQKAGYISEDAVIEIAQYFNLSPVEVEGVCSFYTQFKTEKPAKYKIAVCDGTACHIKGSPLVLNWLSDEIDKKDDKLFSIETVACLGCCSLAPVISINGKIYGNLDREALIEIIEQYRDGDVKDD